MICLHRIRGEELWVNPDLIVFVEGGAHDTVVTLADGNRVLVTEPPTEVSAAVLRFRSTILAAADELSSFYFAPQPPEPKPGTVVSIQQIRKQQFGG